jgi:hypothetical protein
MQLLVIILAFLAGSAQAAGIQKWIDENGQVHYGDNPPAKVTTESVRVSRPPSNPGKALPRLNNQQTNSDQQQDAEASNTPADQQDPASQAPPDQAGEFCEQARKDMRVLNNSSRIRLRASDGTSRFMTDEEREQRRVQSQADIDRYCQ